MKYRAVIYDLEFAVRSAVQLLEMSRAKDQVRDPLVLSGACQETEKLISFIFIENEEDWQIYIEERVIKLLEIMKHYHEEIAFKLLTQDYANTDY